jgi:citrate lyase subunit beta / citryl-CoA lyase
MPTYPQMQRPAARSYLFVPGDRPERFDKAWASQADEVIIDLEDAVAPEKKALARVAIAGWLDASRPVWVRVNAMDSAWFEDDLSLALRPGMAGLMLPKAEELPPSLISLCGERGLAILPIVETAVGMRNAEKIAATPPVSRLAFGTLDFQVDLDIVGDDDALLAFRSHLVLVSRLAGIPAPIDGVTTSIDDLDFLRSDTGRSRRLGFGAKLCIHPRQVAEVHRVFAPTEEEREWARRVLQATEDSHSAAVALDGKMIDRPVWLKAARIAGAPAAGSSLRG